MASSSILLAELNFLAPQFTPKRRRSLSRFYSRYSVSKYKYNVNLRMRICAVKKEGASALIEEELVERANDDKWTGNGAASASASSVVNGRNGSVIGYVNGSEIGVGNGSVVKYVNGNGVAAEVVEDGRKRKLEEIGKEDAWFKRSEEAQVEVAVAPGGRWSRFKTYSTIQRTLEIWGFVIKFIFKSWLSNQKFSYRGLLFLIL